MAAEGTPNASTTGTLHSSGGSIGLFNYNASNFPASDYYSTPEERYNIVVYFSNTASVGRTARKTKLTLADV